MGKGKWRRGVNGGEEVMKGRGRGGELVGNRRGIGMEVDEDRGDRRGVESRGGSEERASREGKYREGADGKLKIILHFS